MEVLVTGAGGFVGEALCRALVASGDEVVAMWHRHEQRLNALSGMGGLTKVQGDICNSERVVDLCSGVDAVCHLAVLPPGMPGAAETNIQGTQNVVDACCRADSEGESQPAVDAGADLYDGRTGWHRVPVKVIRQDG